MKKSSVYKTFAYMLAFGILVSNTAYTSYADTANLQGGSWKLENNQWKYYSSDNKLQTGWVKAGDNWYYLDKESGAMKSGWFQDDAGSWYFLSTAEGADNGKMLSGWQWIDGKAYFFDNTEGGVAGRMFSGTVTPDGYRLNADGQWVDDNGNVVIDNTKGLSSKVQPASRSTGRTTAPRGGSSGGGSSGGGFSSGGSSSGTSGADTQRPSQPDNNQSQNGNQNQDNGNQNQNNYNQRPDNGNQAPDNDNQKPHAEDNKPDNNNTNQDNKASDSNAEPDKKDEDNTPKEPKILSYIALPDVSVDFIDENVGSYIAALPKSVTYRLSNGKKIALRITDWSFDAVPAQETTTTARPTVVLDASREYLRASFEAIEVSIKVSFKKPADNNNNGGSVEEPDKPDKNATLTGYEAFEDVTLDYKDKFASSYKDKLPKKVVYKLSDNSKIELNINDWAFEQVPEAGLKTRAKAVIFSIPVEYNNWAEDIEAMPAYVNVKFKETQVSGDELKLTWDHEAVKRYGSEEYTYRYDENPVISMENYTGDGSDISFTAYLVPNKTFTVGNGIAYDAANKKFTIDTGLIFADDFRENFRAELKVGAKTFSIYMKFTTDKKVKFEGSSSETSIRYDGISRKKDTLKEISFTNVAESEYQNIRFTTLSGEDLSDAVKLVEDGGKLKVRFIIEKLRPYISSSTYSGDFVTVYMRLKGLKNANIRLNLVPKPSISIDKSKGYYAKLNPVLTLRNFDAIEADNLKVYYYAGTKAEGTATELVKDAGYTFDAAEKKLTIDSLTILQSATLTADKDYVIKVVHEDDEATAAIKYKKDKHLSVAEAKKANPYSKAVVRINGVDDSDIINDTTVGVYNGMDKIAGTKAITTGNATDFRVEIPYSSVKDLLVNNKVTLTLKVEGIEAIDFELEYADIEENGVAVPLEITKDRHGAEFSKKQDGLVVFYKTASVYLNSKARSIKEDEWKSMGVNIRKKGAADADAIELSVDEAAKDWATTPIEIKGVALEGLYIHQSKLGVIEKDSDGKWPVYTLTFYLNGYKKTEIDIVLSSEQEY